ncbi:hypothetical protein EDB84DRAFT_1634957 [Lactarius hengduanensis]|nr:hypothetical protein EDB84DRAFT_1634957 [Lactarius hengduanensis]
MNHVWEGCLARERQSIHPDGSRVEGPHKGWNSLQHAQLSGLAVLVALGHDHVLRRNIRQVHHTRLANYTAKFWNKLRLSFDQDVHSPDTVIPGPLPCINSLPPKRRVTERIDSTREGPERPPANKRLRTATTSESLPPRARTSGTSGRRPHRLLNPLPPTTQHAFPPPEGAGLTRSRRLFTISTGVHIAAGTAPVGVVPDDAAEVHSTTLKNPGAIVAMLGTVEATVADPLATGNYKCEPAPSQTKGTETFWWEHYHTVRPLKEGQPDRDKDREIRKPASCPRCKRFMYPGPTGSLDKWGYCSDGVRSKPPDNAPLGYLPPWPQPNGAFSSDAWSTTFNPIPFLATLRDVYEKMVSGGGQNDGAVEFGAFTEMF